MAQLDKLSPTESFWSWREHSACQGKEELFYHGEDERKGLRRRKERMAKEYCLVCPVLEKCREHALAVGELYGVWGGMTEMERHHLTKRHRSG